jgi:hypothetical protein
MYPPALGALFETNETLLLTDGAYIANSHTGVDNKPT